MKILFVASNLQAFGGLQAGNRKLVGVLRELGENVDVLELPRVSLFQKMLFVARFSMRVLFGRPDFVFASNLNYAPMGFFAKKLLGVPYAVRIWGIEVQRTPKPLHRQALRATDCVVTAFSETARNVVRQIPETKERLVTIPNTIEGSPFEIKPRREDLVQKFKLGGAKVILTIGRMSILDGDNKGYMRVIRAMPKILKNVPNVLYLLAGTGDDVPNVQKLVKELGLIDKVVLAGPVEAGDMVDFYNLGDVFALPSKNEGFPAFVLLEALACGVPVLGGAQPDARELFHEKYGLIVQPDSVEEISQSLVKILSGDVPTNILDRIKLRSMVLREYGPEAYREAVKKAVQSFSAQTKRN